MENKINSDFKGFDSRYFQMNLTVVSHILSLNMGDRWIHLMYSGSQKISFLQMENKINSGYKSWAIISI